MTHQVEVDSLSRFKLSPSWVVAMPLVTARDAFGIDHGCGNYPNQQANMAEHKWSQLSQGKRMHGAQSKGNACNVDPAYIDVGLLLDTPHALLRIETR